MKKPQNLTRRNYYSKNSQKLYMSASQYKDFLRCEAAALARIKGQIPEQSSTALLVGSYVDAHFSGEADRFAKAHPEIFKKDGTLKAEFAHADYIISRIEEQPEMMRYFSGEHQKIFIGEIAGVPFKCRVDSYLPDEAIVDGKVMRDFEPKYVPEQGRVPWFEYWGYDIQGAIYQELVRQNTGKKLPFILNAATKEEEPDLALLKVEQSLLDYQLAEVKKNAPRFDAIKNGIIKPTRCEHCEYCKRTKKITLIGTEALIDAE